MTLRLTRTAKTSKSKAISSSNPTNSPCKNADQQPDPGHFTSALSIFKPELLAVEPTQDLPSIFALIDHINISTSIVQETEAYANAAADPDMTSSILADEDQNPPVAISSETLSGEATAGQPELVMQTVAEDSSQYEGQYEGHHGQSSLGTNFWWYGILGLAFVGGIALALSHETSSSDAAVAQTVDAVAKVDYTLQLLHFSDAEGGVLATSTAPNLAALVDKFEDAYSNSITLQGGDNFIPSPFLAAGTDISIVPALNALTGSTLLATSNIPFAAVDMAIQGAIGVEASAIGNHEYDLGSRVLRDAIAGNGLTKPAQFPYISANLDFSDDASLKPLFVDNTAISGLELASDFKGKIIPSAILKEGGENIGLVGATTQILESISSPTGTEVKGYPTGVGANGEVDNMDLLASQLQPVIDDLIAQGVDKVILLSHLQLLSNERLLATKLKGVDVIVSAGSHTRLGDETDLAIAYPGHKASFLDTYPIVTHDAEGFATLIVNTDNEYTYLGRLVVDFDADGHVIADTVADHAKINGAYAAVDSNVAAAWGTTVDQLGSTAFAVGTRGGDVKTLTDAVQSVISVKDGNIFGYSHVYLEGESSQVRGQETNLGNLSADANDYVATLAVQQSGETVPDIIVSLKNGGGIRAQIGVISSLNADGTVDKLPTSDHTVSQLDVENALRFNNRLMMFDTTAEGLKSILEHGVASGTGQGRFPQIGDIRFTWDPDLAAGSRILDLSVEDNSGKTITLYKNGVLVGNDTQTLSVVTLSYLANGGDGYLMKAVGDDFRFLTEHEDGSFTLSKTVDEAINFTNATDIASYVSGADQVMGEQSAFERYMHAFHGTLETAYNVADTPVAQDLRIQNLNYVAL